ncbi:MAG TPA: purine nucleoside permease [Povalibacter sp.]
MRSTAPLRQLFLSILLALFATGAWAAEPPIEIKVVVVTMFEIGSDTGDTAGEFQLWHERQKLATRLPFAHHHDLFLNKQTGVLGMVTGMGTANSATAVMALALDPRFDLSKAYWLVAGIAGVDPQDAPIGSAAWAEYLVDGDLAHEIDAREMPKEWTSGYWPLHSAGPNDPNRPGNNGEVFRLNPALTEWAYQLSREVKLPDNAGLQRTRAKFKGYPQAQTPPYVLKGDNLAAMTFWHGKLLNDWANDWVKFWTGGKGNFVTSAMEDTGTYLSLSYVHPTGKVNKERLMVLRTASNYTMPPPGMTAAEHMRSENEGYSGLNDSVEAAYRVGSVVVDEVVSSWSKYRDHTPAAKVAE